MNSTSIFLSLFCISLSLKALAFSDDQEIAAVDVRKNLVVAPKTYLKENLENAHDAFSEGYIQALIDQLYSEHDTHVRVVGKKVFLSNLPKNELLSNSIKTYIENIAGVESVEIEYVGMSEEQKKVRETYLDVSKIKGIWFPQSTALFYPLLADPRQPVYSVVPRFSDEVVGKHAVSVSYGDEFPFFRWKEVFKWKGDMQVGLLAGVWAVFNFDHHAPQEFSELVNADYMVGIPVVYAVDKWSWRARFYHISSHLGDEVMCGNRKLVDERCNPSFEALDAFVSYQFSSAFRAYGGVGYIVHSDKGFKLDPVYIQYGTEVRLFGHNSHHHGLYGTPFLAIHMSHYQQHKWDLDYSMKVGYEVSQLEGLGRKMRVFGGYHHGFSFEGQFSNKRTRYWEYGISWGF